MTSSLWCYETIGLQQDGRPCKVVSGRRARLSLIPDGDFWIWDSVVSDRLGKGNDAPSRLPCGIEGSAPEGLAKELAANTAFWQPIVKATGYKIEN
jgi:hypothetical protein